MKRAIFSSRNIELDLEHGVFATPIGPHSLRFEPGEEMLVALPRKEAGPLGEYQFRYVVGESLGEDPLRGDRLYGPRWKHFYRIAAVQEVQPFGLADVVAAAGARGPEVSKRYKGQTLHQLIIVDVKREDEPLFRSLIVPGHEPVWSAGRVIEKRSEAIARRGIKSEGNAERLLRLDRENRRLPAAANFRPGRTQVRNREFVERLKALYDCNSQVCGERICGPSGRPRADVHHLEPWQGDGSDLLRNVICVCPNDHARFEVGALRWNGRSIEEHCNGLWRERPLIHDRHLLVQLSETAGAI